MEQKNSDDYQADISRSDSTEKFNNPTEPLLTLCVCGSSHSQRTCDHEFSGWREFDDGRGGEQVCKKCGLGAMAYSLSLDW